MNRKDKDNFVMNIISGLRFMKPHKRVAKTMEPDVVAELAELQGMIKGCEEDNNFLREKIQKLEKQNRALTHALELRECEAPHTEYQQE